MSFKLYIIRYITSNNLILDFSGFFSMSRDWLTFIFLASPITTHRKHPSVILKLQKYKLNKMIHWKQNSTYTIFLPFTIRQIEFLRCRYLSAQRKVKWIQPSEFANIMKLLCLCDCWFSGTFKWSRYESQTSMSNVISSRKFVQFKRVHIQWPGFDSGVASRSNWNREITQTKGWERAKEGATLPRF